MCSSDWTRSGSDLWKTSIVAAPSAVFVRSAEEIAADAAALTVPAAWPEGTKRAWTGGHATPAQAVAAYRARAAATSEADRTDEGRAKTGVP